MLGGLEPYWILEVIQQKVIGASLGRMRPCGAVDAERERGVRKRAWARLEL